MKTKLVVLALSVILSLNMFGCGILGKQETDSSVYKMGDYIETDILGLTLNKAQLTIKMNSTGSAKADGSDYHPSKNYFLADDYNPETDSGLAYVASKGHTFVAIEYCVENLDRTSVDFEGSSNSQFITVKYDGKKYNGKNNTKIGWVSDDGIDGKEYNSSNILLLAGEKKTFRCYVDIPVDVEDLNSEFELSFYLPKSDGGTKKFSYSINAED